LKNSKTKIIVVAGTRPNFMKIAPIVKVLGSSNSKNINWKIAHTGQHHDYEMSQAFFDDLQIPEPDYFLKSGSASHAVQTARVMTEFEKVCMAEKPDIVIVVGDVNSTLAAAVTAKKLNIKVAHVEAGLRSGDMSMPEEINRIVTDSISDYLFTTEKSGIDNLLKEGKARRNIFFVGHVMIDNLFQQLKRLNNKNTLNFNTHTLKSKLKNYLFLTLHRPSNVDSKRQFRQIISALNEIARELPIIFPAHPRTLKMLKKCKAKLNKNIHLTKPLVFSESLYLWKDARIVMTDSGGLQEETTALGIPCLTLRNNTERPITVTLGTNIIAGNTKKSILKAYSKAKKTSKKPKRMPPKWDGNSSKRIIKILVKHGNEIKN